MRKAFALFLLLLPSVLAGQDYEKRTYQTQRAVISPLIDGELDDEAWATGNWEGNFWQYEPNEGGPVSQKTEFSVIYDNENIFVAIKAYDTAPDSIVSRLTRRDDIDGDELYVYFDSYHDLRTAFGFGVSAAGVKSDLVMTEDGSAEDETWDPIWYVKTTVTDWGWAAEMKIPLTQLRFSATEKQLWGFEVVRVIYRHDETDFWQPIARNASGLVHNAGLLGGISDIKPWKQFDITPYGVARLETYEGKKGNPFLDGSDIKANAGLDAKIGITNNMIMSLTVNPDFGQVEADPSEVNLTGFETYFREKRPFFVEGRNITDFNLGLGGDDEGNDNLFYSRRIGRSPGLSHEDQDNEYSYTPSFTPIIGAAKLTGKSENGWSVGALEAITARVKSKIYNEVTGDYTHETVEPLTNYTLGRVQKDIDGGNTIIGGMFTTTLRDLEENTEPYLHKSALTAGVDFTQYFGKMKYIFQLHTAFSNVNGSKNAIARTQQSLVHNLGRPDAGYVEYDPMRTSLYGSGGNLMAGKIGGNLQLIYLSSWKSPGFDPNDVGYMQVADQYLGVGVVGYRINKPFGIFNRMNFTTNLIHLHDFGGRMLLYGQSLAWSTQFRNLWSAYCSSQVNSPEQDNLILRGGPSMKIPGAGYIEAGIESSEQKKLVAEISASKTWGFENHYSNRNVTFELSYRPFKNISLEIEPEWEQRTSSLQYVTTVSLTSGIYTPGYIFASIDQKTLGLSVRADYNITPDLTIQYWGQPFFGSGKYSEIKRITDTDATLLIDKYHAFTEDEISLSANNEYSVDENGDDLPDYTFANPNFTRSEFLSNLVVRWEFMPGSTAYFVWSQSRDYRTDDGLFDLGPQIYDIFINEKPHNIFLIKLSYRFGLR